MKKKKIEEDMSNTFVLEVGQKSAIFDDDMAREVDENEENEMDDDFFDKPKRKKKNKNKKQKKKVKKIMVL